MTDLTSAQMLRAKIIGTLIRGARISVGDSSAACAQAIGVIDQEYEAYELGEALISLPELEALAYHLKIPLEHFLFSQSLSDQVENRSDSHNIQRLIQLRHRMIGAQVRQTRLENKKSLKELSEQIKIDLSRLEAIELGLEAIPVILLEELCNALNCSLREFQDQHGPIGSWFVQQKAASVITEFEPELQAFISKPINKPYLELAKRMSEMSTEKLRVIAEGILEITF